MVTLVGFEPRRRSFDADLSCLSEARDFAARAAVDFGGLGPDALYAVRLAMSEAVTNAICHGSSSERDPIWILALGEGDALVFEVRDTGRFRPRIARSGDMTERGRGLEFMRVLMDEVQVRPGADGTCVRFALRRSS